MVIDPSVEAELDVLRAGLVDLVREFADVAESDLSVLYVDDHAVAASGWECCVRPLSGARPVRVIVDYRRPTLRISITPGFTRRGYEQVWEGPEDIAAVVHVVRGMLEGARHGRRW